MSKEKIAQLDHHFSELLLQRFPEFAKAQRRKRNQSVSSKRVLKYLRFTLNLTDEEAHTILFHRDWFEPEGFLFQIEFGNHPKGLKIANIVLQDLSDVLDDEDASRYYRWTWGAGWFKLGITESDIKNRLHEVFDLYDKYRTTQPI